MDKRYFTVLRVAAEVVLLGVLLYFSYDPLRQLAEEVRQAYFPCSRPLTYRLDIFDDRFDLSREDFLAIAAEAEQVWEGPAGRQLLALADDGGLRLNLIYDYRQEATDKLGEMGLTITSDKASYESLKSRYDQAVADYRRRKDEYEARVRDFESRQKDYEQEVASWNRRGGAPPAQFEKLNAVRDALQAELGQLKILAAAVNEQAGQVNALVTVLNKLINELNLTADKFNSVVEDRGQEFQQGTFRDSTAGNEIDIFEFEDRRQLLRVLAHEFGHALGLDHLDDPDAIMNMRNVGTGVTASAADIRALTARCGFR